MLGGRAGGLLKSKTKENLTTSFNIHTDRHRQTDTHRHTDTSWYTLWGARKGLGLVVLSTISSALLLLPVVRQQSIAQLTKLMQPS